MGTEDRPDEQKRQTLRQFAAVGAVGPFAAVQKSRAIDATSDRPLELLEYVASYPGVHFSKIRDDLGLGTGETQYHLRRLESSDHIESIDDGEYRRLFLSHQFSRVEHGILSMLRRPTHAAILIAGLAEEPVGARTIAELRGVSSPAVSRAARDLEMAGLLDRTGGQYTVLEQAEIESVLSRFGESLDEETIRIANQVLVEADLGT